MARSIADKLKIKAGTTVHLIHEPKGYAKAYGKIPAGVKFSETPKGATQIHWFVENKAQMEKELPKILKMLTPEITIWIFYPKGTSGIQTDLTRDKGWDTLLKHDLKWISLISFDSTWSTFGMRLKTDTDVKKEAAPKKREIFDWIDPVKKTVRVPEDLGAAFRKNKKAETYFNSLAFSHRKEYVEWIVTAKREETRAERIKGTIERLNKSWKNPRNL
jgi:hypothetical protein